MTEPERILTRIIQWAAQEEPIRAMILEGSRASVVPADPLADFDISVFTRTYAPYLQDDRWLTAISEVWVYVPEQYEWGGEKVQTRLVIFKDGVKVDFSFFGVHELAALAHSDDLDAGYKVLLEKDGETDRLPKPTFKTKPPPLPTEQDYLRLVREFWFETYHVAKYLKREDLWLVKARDWGTKDLLLKVMEWHARAKHQWDYDTGYGGKSMKSWIDASVWQALFGCFAHFDRDDSWNGLLASIELFRQLATEVAEQLGFVYPEAVDRNITGFIFRLQRWPSKHS